MIVGVKKTAVRRDDERAAMNETSRGKKIQKEIGVVNVNEIELVDERQNFGRNKKESRADIGDAMNGDAVDDFVIGQAQPIAPTFVERDHFNLMPTRGEPYRKIGNESFCAADGGMILTNDLKDFQLVPSPHLTGLAEFNTCRIVNRPVRCCQRPH